jgi:hypothetical protein
MADPGIGESRCATPFAQVRKATMTRLPYPDHGNGKAWQPSDADAKQP